MTKLIEEVKEIIFLTVYISNIVFSSFESNSKHQVKCHRQVAESLHTVSYESYKLSNYSMPDLSPL